MTVLTGAERDDLEKGGKIILPPSALDQLTRLNIIYPMLFKLTNASSGRTTHCGVLEFVADEGKVYIPYWMMQNLTMGEGDLLQVESASLPVATYAKFQPHSVDFIDLTNPKAVLEARLRNFACLSKGDVIAIFYNNKTYELSVLETKPADAVSVIECDLNVDFAAPVGYKEPQRPNANQGGQGHGDDDDEEEEMDVSDMIPQPKFSVFGGTGNRLDGKKGRKTSESDLTSMASTSSLQSDYGQVEYVRGIPDYDYEFGNLKFIRGKPKKSTNEENNEDDSNSNSGNNFQAFQGQGKSLRSNNDSHNKSKSTRK